MFVELNWDSFEAQRLVDNESLAVARKDREYVSSVARYAFFIPHNGGVADKHPRSVLVAYQRFKDCTNWGCSINGTGNIYENR